MTILLIGLAALILVTALHAVFVAPRDLRVSVIDAPISELPRQFDGYTIAVIADLHHWGTNTQYLRRVIRLSNAATPDLVALLGDYGISFEHNQLLSARAYRHAFPSLLGALREIRAPDGCVAILGNHDYYFDGRQVGEWLQPIARVLVNDHIILQRDDARLIIGGVGDTYEDRVDPLGGAGRQPSGTPVIVLSHNPDAVEQLDAQASIELVLSGHTHGGQVVIPGYGAVTTHARICGRKTASGWIPNARLPLYVSRGVGVQTPIRFRCPPELVIVRLRIADQQPA